MKKALIAMSGGVDSSVAALAMVRRGWECAGCTMRLYDNADAGRAPGRTCCSLEDVEDARSVAFRLGMPYHVFNFTEEFRQRVMEPFVSAYRRGETRSIVPVISDFFSWLDAAGLTQIYREKWRAF